MKRFLAVLLIFILVLTWLVGCKETSTQPEPEEQINGAITSEYELLLGLMELPDGSDMVVQYLLEWADNREVNAQQDAYGNIIMTKAPAEDQEEGQEERPSVILQCMIRSEDPPACARSIACILHTLENASGHGPLSAIFTSKQDDAAIIGAQKIHSKHLNADYLINLDWAKEGEIGITSALTTDFALGKPITWTQPLCTRAYEISIQGLDESIPFDFTKNNLNPIKALGDLLAGAKSNNILFELAGINGGLDTNVPPTAATAVILLNDNDVNKFIRRFTSAQEKLIDKHSTTHPMLTYTLSEIPLPDKVVSAEDCTSIISLLYTMFNGVYLRAEDGSVVAASSINTISTNTGHFAAGVRAKSISEETMLEFSTTLETICGLCNIQYALSDTIPMWTQDPSCTLVAEMTAALNGVLTRPVNNGSTFEQPEWIIFARRNPDLQVISLGIGEKDLSRIALALLHFLDAGQTEKYSTA